MFDSVLRLLSQLRQIQPCPELHADLPLLFTQLRQADNRTAPEIEDAIWQAWEWHASLQASNSLNKAIGAIAHQEFDDALEMLDSLLETYPTYAEAWNKRATLHYLRGHDALAVQDIERTLELEPRHFGALAGLGQIMVRQEKPMLAPFALQIALQINPHMHQLAQVLHDLEGRVPSQLH